jgi:hypothetical protein
VVRVITRRGGEVIFAGFLSLAGLSFAAMHLLKNPASWLYRWVDRNILPYEYEASR